jgi:hypothetical protein
MNRSFHNNWLPVLTACCLLGVVAGCQRPESAPVPQKTQEVITPEERLVRREAKNLGERLYAVVKEEPKTTAEEDKQQEKLQPVYDDIEKFIFRQLQPFRNRVASITVVYKNAGVLCIVYVKPGSEDELQSLKRATDSCIGKVVDDLPLVRYLIVRNQRD